MTLLVLIGLAVIVMYEPTTALYQCTPQQTMNIGSFKCLSNCDENHIAQGQFGPKKYCLNYLPNGGSCFMKPYTRTDVFSCGGKAGGSNPPMWIIMVGGSNMYMMLKTLIDKMLDLPGNAGYNPAAYWGAQIHTSDGKPPYAEMALMDFIWDGNRNLVRKTAWWFDGLPSDQPSKTQGIFESVPGPKAGGLRISFINMHQAAQFQDRMNRVMKSGTAWLNARPRLQIWEEWSGLWDDINIPKSVHEGNLQYLKNRQAKEGLNIASYVFTDSGPDCNNGEEAQMLKVKGALTNVQTTFPKYYFSKQGMIYQQWQLTGKCNAFQGHTVEPMNVVFWTRYFNLVCNPTSPPPYAASIPACVDLGDYTNTNSRCYGGAGANNKWMDTIMQVCLVNNKYIANGPRSHVQLAANQQHTQKRRICKLQYVNITDTAEAGVAMEGEEHLLTSPGTSTLEALVRLATVV